ncbi:MAG: hypothetical protein Q4F97_07955 [Bacteroidales bacterium]|nr:hypothetical protein [Bacteroidales bacterium]
MNRISFLLLFFIFHFVLTFSVKAGISDLQRLGIKGKVKSFKTRCYSYNKYHNGTYSLNKSLLEYAGNSYDVEQTLFFNIKGFITKIDNDFNDNFIDSLHFDLKSYYDKNGNKVYSWQDEYLVFTSVFNSDNLCIEEKAVLKSGEEYYHNFHKYDNQGKRIETIFTSNGVIIEKRKNPPSDNILDEGNIVSTDSIGNWTKKLFIKNNRSGFIVIRDILYY